MKSFKNKTIAQKGFTLIELLLSLSIILVLSVTAFIVYSKAKDKSDSQTENSNLSTLQAGIKGLYSGRPLYTGLTGTVLLNAQVVPNPMIGAGNTILNVWKGNVTIQPASLGGIAANAYSITYPNVPQAVCVNLAAGAGNNFDTVQINGNTVKAYGVQDIDTTTVTTQCAAGNIANTLIFTAR